MYKINDLSFDMYSQEYDIAYTSSRSSRGWNFIAISCLYCKNEKHTNNCLKTCILSKIVTKKMSFLKHGQPLYNYYYGPGLAERAY